MKRSLLLIIIIILESIQAQAQVAINSTGSNPEASAILDIKSTSSGLLLPRMTFEQRNAIQGPAEGLLIYCVDCSADGTGLISVYLDSIWVTLDEYCVKPNPPAAGIHDPLNNQITWNWLPVDGAEGYKWNTSREYETAINCYDYLSHTQTGLNCGTEYRSFIWSYDNCGHSASIKLVQSTVSTQVSGSPVTGSHIAEEEQITWVWNLMTGATGYKWNTVNNFESAVDLEESTSHTETGLSCGTNYTRYAWAYGPCWYSLPLTLSKSTLNCQGGGECEAFIDSRDGQYYPVVQIGTQCWLGKNLNTGTMLYAEEEELNNGIIEKHCYNDQSSNCNIYGGLYSREEMLQFVFDDNQGVCPSGWHIPSVSEWNTLISYLGGYSVAGGKMKETGTLHWQSPNTGASNLSGFTGLPGGQFAFWSYSDLHTISYFWALEECEMPPGIFYTLAYYTDDIEEMCGSLMENCEFSVRCLKNEEP